MVNFKVLLVLLLEAKDIIYLIWNLICNMVDIPKINSKIPFCALGDGHATIATWLPSRVTKRLVPMKKRVHANIMNGMGVIHTHQGVLCRNTIDLSSGNTSFPLKHLLKVDNQLHLRETWEIYSIQVKKGEAGHKYGARAVDLQSHLWLQLPSILVVTLIINTLIRLLAIKINTNITKTMDILSNIILRIISTMYLILTMATSHISHMEDTMDMKVVTMDKQDVMLTITNLKSVYFLRWQLTKTACLIVSVMFDQRW